MSYGASSAQVITTKRRSCSPYDILDLPVGASDNEVKKQYRKKSLLIHPDKFKHPRGIEVRFVCLSCIIIRSQSSLLRLSTFSKR